MNVGAPGRTRTCNLLFRRCLSLDAVPEREVPGRWGPWSESYPLVLAAVLYPGDSARVLRDCFAPVGLVGVPGWLCDKAQAVRSPAACRRATPQPSRSAPDASGRR